MKYLLYTLIAIFLFSCNKDIAVDIDPQDIAEPDYNLLSEAPGFFKYDKESNKYSTNPTIYLRPFENVTNLDNVTLKFDSNNFAQYIIKGDTLYNNDKINIRYADFKNYLLIFKYQSEKKGQHEISIETTIRSVTKETKLSITTTE
ncbi:hypothetical protein GCM10007423_63560 [Dyadobacter endophyticus]|uniref:Uncharacterized protein n=1 Tax=Dyadobacter endophyticus TaxID=1749036 RepID=A0ABQ1ZDH8_9BACT|nr:hypothetical protein [Dyadobacter endophyticus]GGH55719.1 hypothetical protein GCM10007423_63560 [Dyadobacter endophyticus]